MSQETKKSLVNDYFEDTVKEAVATVLDELHRRLPKTNKDGFLAEPEVYEAVAFLLEFLKEGDEVLLESFYAG